MNRRTGERFGAETAAKSRVVIGRKRDHARTWHHGNLKMPCEVRSPLMQARTREARIGFKVLIVAVGNVLNAPGQRLAGAVVHDFAADPNSRFQAEVAGGMGLIDLNGQRRSRGEILRFGRGNNEYLFLLAD